MRTIHHLKELLFLILVSKCGGEVANQFINTWSGEPVHEQNGNAMEEIKFVMKNLVEGGFFSEDSIMEIQDYLKTINEDDREEDDENDQMNENKKVVKITESQLKQIIQKVILDKKI